MEATDVTDVLGFWFTHKENWWKRSSAFDDDIRKRFEPLRTAIMNGEHEAWRETPKGALAYVLVLDQFSRNMYRGDRRSYEGDAKALMAARHAIAVGSDASLSTDEQMFLYMPFMHSEDLGNQEQSVTLFRALGAESLHFAEQHRDIIFRFGRFPHRNAVLGRLSSVKELRFLQTPGSSFAA